MKTRAGTKIKVPKVEKTPKSDRSRRTAPDTPNNDWLCSQHFDPDVLVGWDCNSPETVRNIRRIQGDDCNTGISEIVKQLMDRSPDPDTPQPGGTPRLLARWKAQMETNNNQLLPRTPVRRTRRRGVSRRLKAESDAMSRDLLQRLETALERQAARKQQEEAEETAETVSKAQDVSDDLSDSSLIRNLEVDSGSPTVRVSSRLAEIAKQETGVTKPANSACNGPYKTQTSSTNTGVTKSTSSACNGPYKTQTSSTNNGVTKSTSSACKLETNTKSISSVPKPETKTDEDLWSDDEMFEDDSFVIKATQLPPKVFDGVGLGMKRRTSAETDSVKPKHPRQTFQIGSPTSSVPPIASTSTGISSDVRKSEKSSATDVKCVSSRPVAYISGVSQVRNGSSNVGKSQTPSTADVQCVSSRPVTRISGVSQVRNVPKSTGNLGTSTSNNTRLTSNLGATTVNAGTIRAASSASSLSGNVRNVSTSCSSTKLGALKMNRTSAPVSGSVTLSSASRTEQVSSICTPRNGPYKTQTSSTMSNVQKTPTSCTVVSNVHKAQTSSTVMSKVGKTPTSSALVSNVQSCLQSAKNSQFSNLPRYTNSVASKTSTVTCTSNKTSTVTCTSNKSSTVTCTSNKSSTVTCSSNNSSTVTCTSGSKTVTSTSASKPRAVICAINKQSSCRSDSKTAASTSVQSVKSSAKVGTQPPNDSEFDTSLSEDILLQLTEPDELLDSQAFVSQAGKRKKPDLPNAINSAGTRTDRQVSGSKTTVSREIASVQKKQDLPSAKNSASTRTYGQVCGSKNTVSKVNVDLFKKDGKADLVEKKRMVNSNLESQGQNKRFTFKASQKPGESKNISATNNRSNKPITGNTCVVQSNKDVGRLSNEKQGNKDEGKEKQQTKKPSTAVSNEFSEDLFMSDDDGLTEPQILAMLDEAELLATQQIVNSQKSSSQKSNQSNQGQPHSSQGQPHSSPSQANCSPGQPSSSPNKYSAAEIERKKQEALQRRKKKIPVQVK